MVPHSVQDPWLKIRPEVSAVDDLMTADGAGSTPTKDWASRDTVLTALPIGNEGRTIPVAANLLFVGLMGLLTAGDPDDETCTINIWLYHDRGPAEFVCSATYTFGKQLVVLDPTIDPTVAVAYKYADTVETTDIGWQEGKITVTPDDGVGSEDIALISFARFGAAWIKVEIAALSDPALKVVPILRYAS